VRNMVASQHDRQAKLDTIQMSRASAKARRAAFAKAADFNKRACLIGSGLHKSHAQDMKGHEKLSVIERHKEMKASSKTMKALHRERYLARKAEEEHSRIMDKEQRQLALQMARTADRVRDQNRHDLLVADRKFKCFWKQVAGQVASENRKILENEDVVEYDRLVSKFNELASNVKTHSLNICSSILAEVRDQEDELREDDFIPRLLEPVEPRVRTVLSMGDTFNVNGLVTPNSEIVWSDEATDESTDDEERLSFVMRRFSNSPDKILTPSPPTIVASVNGNGIGRLSPNH